MEKVNVLFDLNKEYLNVEIPWIDNDLSFKLDRLPTYLCWLKEYIEPTNVVEARNPNDSYEYPLSVLVGEPLPLTYQLWVKIEILKTLLEVKVLLQMGPKSKHVTSIISEINSTLNNILRIYNEDNSNYQLRKVRKHSELNLSNVFDLIPSNNYYEDFDVLSNRAMEVKIEMKNILSELRNKILILREEIEKTYEQIESLGGFPLLGEVNPILSDPTRLARKIDQAEKVGPATKHESTNLSFWKRKLSGLTEEPERKWWQIWRR
jgi:hypothetical protein